MANKVRMSGIVEMNPITNVSDVTIHSSNSAYWEFEDKANINEDGVGASLQIYVDGEWVSPVSIAEDTPTSILATYDAVLVDKQPYRVLESPGISFEGKTLDLPQRGEISA